MVMVLSKSDILKLDNMEDRSAVMRFLEGKRYLKMSVENIDAMKAMGCNFLLDERFEKKISSKLAEYINRITIVRPRDEGEGGIFYLHEGGNERERYFVRDEHKYDIVPKI